MPDMKEIGANLTEGLLGGIGQSITQGYRRRQRVEHDTNVSKLKILADILHDPEFRGDPQARQDLLGQYLDQLDVMKGGGGKGKGKGGGDQRDQMHGFLDKIFSKVYPSGQGRPPIPGSVQPGPKLAPQPGDGGGGKPPFSPPQVNPAMPGIADQKGPFLSQKEKEQRIASEAGAKADATQQAHGREVEQEVGIKNRGALDYESQASKQRQQGVDNLVTAGYSRPEAMAMMGVTPPHETTPTAQKPIRYKLKGDVDFKPGFEDPRKPGSYTDVAGKPIDSSKVEDIQTGSDDPKGQLGELAKAQKDMKEFPAGHPRHEAAKEYLRLEGLKAKGQEVRIYNQSQSATPPKDAIDSAAEYFISSGGHMPANLGRGGQGLKVMGRVQSMLKERGMSMSDVIARGGDVAALRGSLTNMEKLYDTLSAFERTASTNLDRAIKAIKPIIDTGSPYINKVFRGAARVLFGDPDTAKFETARLVAFTEIAKVLNNVNSNAALSDTARKEAEEVIRGDYTIGQLMEVAGILKQDMTTRLSETKNQLQDIRGRLKGDKGDGGDQRPKPSKAGAALDAETVKKYLDLAGGDKDKARSMAKEDGWAVK